MSNERRGLICDHCGGLVGLAYCWDVVDGVTAWFCARCQGDGLDMRQWAALREQQRQTIRARRAEPKRVPVVTCVTGRVLGYVEEAPGLVRAELDARGEAEKCDEWSEVLP